MFRLMEPADLPAMEQLWAAQQGGPAELAEKAILRFAGAENAYVAPAADGLRAMVLAVPVTLQGRPGCYLCGLSAREDAWADGAAAGLLDYACEEQARRGAAFLAAAPAGAQQAAFYADRGFGRAFPLRCLTKEVRRNLWSQAEFDAVTAKKLCELRRRYCPDAVELDPGRMAVVLGDLYARGVTIVSGPHGYGLYFRREETLYFIELMADDDRSAEVLMEAARQKEVVVEKAVITVGAEQPLFYGEGTRQDYGMIRFAGPPFDVSGCYMRLMLDS